MGRSTECDLLLGHTWEGCLLSEPFTLRTNNINHSISSLNTGSGVISTAMHSTVLYIWFLCVPFPYSYFYKCEIQNFCKGEGRKHRKNHSMGIFVEHIPGVCATALWAFWVSSVWFRFISHILHPLPEVQSLTPARGGCREMFVSLCVQPLVNRLGLAVK